MNISSMSGNQQDQQRPDAAPQGMPGAPWGSPGQAPGQRPWGMPEGYQPPAPEPTHDNSQRVVGIILAVAGIGVTLIGVVLLLVMAAREGILTPGVRVAGGTVLAGILAGVAHWVRPRPGGRVGSLSLMITAVAIAFFGVVAMTRIYEWIPLWAGFALALLVALVAGARAMTWDERLMYVAVVIGVAVLAPCLTEGVTLGLVWFLVALQIAGAVPEFSRPWPEISVVRTAPAVIASLIWPFDSHVAYVDALLPISAIAAVGLVTAVVLGLRRDEGEEAAAIALALSWLPLGSIVWGIAERPERILASAIALVALGTTQYLLKQAPVALRVTNGALLVLAACTFVLTCAQGEWRAAPVLLAAVVLFVINRFRPLPQLVIAACLVTGVGVIIAMTVTPPIDLFYRSRVAHMGAPDLVDGMLMLAVGVSSYLGVHGTTLSAAQKQTALGVAGSVGVLGLIQTLLVGLGRANTTAFFAMHLLVTVLLVALAAVVLIAGLGRPEHLTASMWWGFTLLVLTGLKLLAFDLQYMSLIIRGLTFVLAGLALLAAGTVYARRYAEVAKNRPAPAASQAGPQAQVPVGAWGTQPPAGPAAPHEQQAWGQQPAPQAVGAWQNPNAQGWPQPQQGQFRPQGPQQQVPQQRDPWQGPGQGRHW